MKTLITRFVARILPAVALMVVGAAAAEAQVVYYSALRPVVAAPIAAPAYVANYTPAGNYAAVTAYSPPMFAPSTAVAVTSAYAPAVAPMAVTSFYAPAAAVPVTSYYAPATVAYSPVVAPATVAFSPVVAAPVTTYYAPTAAVAPMYRRGLFGGLRPVRNAYYIPY
jgi:hypothetical protein